MRINTLKQRIARYRTGLIVIGMLLVPALLTYLQQSWLRRNEAPGIPSGASLIATAPESANQPKPTQPQSQGKVVKLQFELLKSWTYIERQNTPIPNSIRKLDGQTVEMVGYMMPLSEVKNVTQFVLVPFLWGCCYGQPPAVNHIMVVNMPEGQTSNFYNDQVRVRGTFHVGETRQNGYLVSLYTITAQSVTTL